MPAAPLFAIMLDTINKYLKRFGLNDSNEPRFRVVWSNDQFEQRRGEFTEFYGTIFVRVFVGVKRVPKYPYISDRYVLECWAPPHQSFNDELPDAVNGTYEPIYVFESAAGDPLSLALAPIELIMGVTMNPRHPATRRNERDYAEIKRDKDQTAYDEDSLECSEISNALHMREAITRP